MVDVSWIPRRIAGDRDGHADGQLYARLRQFLHLQLRDGIEHRDRDRPFQDHSQGDGNAICVEYHHGAGVGGDRCCQRRKRQSHADRHGDADQGSYASAATTLSSGGATINIPAGSLATGTDTLTVSYTPDSGSSSTYNSATGSNTVIVTGASLQVTVGTSPTGLSFSVDGTAYTSTQTLTWTVGSSHTIATTSPQTSSGIQNAFASWSDGGAISHSVTAQSTTTSYTATFSTSYQLTTAANPASGGTVSPASGTFYAAGTQVNLTATPNSGHTFVNWTGNVASSSSASVAGSAVVIDLVFTCLSRSTRQTEERCPSPRCHGGHLRAEEQRGQRNTEG
jgi:hypothetical protein